MWRATIRRAARKLAGYPLREAVAQTGSVRPGQDHSLMPQNFIESGREQVFLMPPDVREWLPEGHLA